MKDKDSQLIWESYQSEKDESGRDYIYKAPKQGHSGEEEMIQILKQMPQGMGELFKPDREGSFYVLTPSDKFESYNSTGDGMGEIEEHDLGYALVGLADGNFLEYIKYPPMDLDSEEPEMPEVHRNHEEPSIDPYDYER